jgi:ubiquinone/menaquinone biosynthesis C-methylase UbiE
MGVEFITALIEDIAASPHQLKRTPESSGVMDQGESVDNFNEVMKTNMTINYAAALDFIYRSRLETGTRPLAALDLCSGPGHYALCVAEYLDYQNLTGVDLSGGMIAKAKQNALNSKNPQAIQFRQGNATALKPGEFSTYDLVTCANSAHHLDSVESVRTMLEFAEKVCRPDGLIALTDLCRLPTQEISDRFVSFFGSDYVSRGLLALAEDFRASMFAAWSADELASAVPLKSDRQWVQVVAGGLPFFQAIIGLPVGRSDLFIRDSKDWVAAGIHRSPETARDWEMSKGSYYAGLVRPLNIPQRTRAYENA